jgi:AbrB family looped-hinge helix DNA binding protein
MSTDDETDGQTTRITRKGQVTIPKELREEFGLEEGDKVRWEKTDDGIRVRKATQSAGRGMLVNDDVSEAEREAVAEEMEAEIRERRRIDWTPE